MVTALVLGPLLSNLKLAEYFRDPQLLAYFKNLVGSTQYYLPGVSTDHPRAGVVNGSLWTIAIELACYLMLAFTALIAKERALTLALIGLTLVLLFPTTPFLGLLFTWLPAKELSLAFCVGALLYAFADRVPHHALIGLPCLGLALLLAHYQSTWSLFPLAYGIIWLGVRRIPAWLTRADYSYGIYLVAYPLQQSLLQLLPITGTWWVNLLFTLPLAFLSAFGLWHGVELPIMKRKREILARFRLGLRRDVGSRDQPIFLT